MFGFSKNIFPCHLKQIFWSENRNIFLPEDFEILSSRLIFSYNHIKFISGLLGISQIRKNSCKPINDEPCQTFGQVKTSIWNKWTLFSKSSSYYFIHSKTHNDCNSMLILNCKLQCQQINWNYTNSLTTNALRLSSNYFHDIGQVI